MTTALKVAWRKLTATATAAINAAAKLQSFDSHQIWERLALDLGSSWGGLSLLLSIGRILGED